MDIKIVIGANAGDEGKGLMTDYFCEEALQKGMTCAVVLHNGGPQRGHTVVRSEKGIRHVFHHFGSGTFAGASTYLDKEFIVNPMVFSREWGELYKIGYNPRLVVHPDCRITTPYDMMLNQIIEEQRAERHGSCGMGINETIKRYERNGDFLRFGNLLGADIAKELRNIRDDIRNVLDERNIALNEEWSEIFYSPELMRSYTIDLSMMLQYAEQSSSVSADRIVFEGGQGLLLDQNNMADFPHLTPSNTGLDNPVDYLKRNKLGLEHIEVCYVTRTYMTKHGAGPMDMECSKEDLGRDIYDLTNVPNPFQGSLRYGRIDWNKFLDRVNKDFSKLAGWRHVEKSIAVTHINEHLLFAYGAGSPQYLQHNFRRVYASYWDGMVQEGFCEI